MEKLSAIVSPLETDRDSLLYDASGRIALLNLLRWLSILLPVIISLLVFSMSAQNLLIAFGSIVKGRVFQFFLVSLSGIFLAAMIWLSNRYILYVTRLKNGKLIISTWHIACRTTARFIASPEYTKYGVYPKRKSVLPLPAISNAPYMNLFINGKKMILDAQGDFPHGEDALMNVLENY